ncbi:type II toxin-antitoxin system RelE/ParE family toxin [Peteryoungia desertarenae]|uniref:type II toxin-antitoxin system RelE/ParE family toxin n=1 Tax=Peteryoungia desertarenae TaxID=1813451 RepID=UPI001FE2D81C|nr:type II toxin-antitoxin system RelE/ParE family toxin [Peteryoungia desertarenae]
MTEGAAIGLERCRRFLQAKSLDAAEKAAKEIKRQFTLLASNPKRGRPLPRFPDLRELTIGFGAAGYVALYRYDEPEDVVHILAFKHQKEAGY